MGWGQRKRWIGAVGVLCAVTAACGGNGSGGRQTGDADALASTTTVAYGDEKTLGIPVATTAAQAAAGTTAVTAAESPTPETTTVAVDASTGMDVRVVDPNGTPRPGIPVRVTGPRNVEVWSDADGRARQALPAGRYSLTAPLNCALQLRILRSATAQIGVPEGTMAPGELVVEVVPRYEIVGPVSYEGDAGWRIGDVHAVRFKLRDPCGKPPPAPAEYRSVRFIGGEGVEVVSLSDRIEPEGWTTISVRCTAEVDVAVAMVDALDPDRRTELIGVNPLPDQRPPFCY